VIPKKKFKKENLPSSYLKKANNQPKLVFNHGTRLVTAGSPKARLMACYNL
jgi:hypothetical protein